MQIGFNGGGQYAPMEQQDPNVQRIANLTEDEVNRELQELKKQYQIDPEANNDGRLTKNICLLDNRQKQIDSNKKRQKFKEYLYRTSQLQGTNGVNDNDVHGGLIKSLLSINKGSGSVSMFITCIWDFELLAATLRNIRKVQAYHVDKLVIKIPQKVSQQAKRDILCTKIQRFKVFFQNLPFLHLKQLYLRQNMLDSVDFLTYIDTSCLQRVDLSMNQLTKVRFLSKMPASNLSEFNASKNFFVILEPLYKFHFGSMFCELNMSGDESLDRESKYQSHESASPLAKLDILQSPRVEFQMHCSSIRERQQKLIEKIKEAYKKVIFGVNVIEGREQLFEHIRNRRRVHMRQLFERNHGGL